MSRFIIAAFVVLTCAFQALPASADNLIKVQTSSVCMITNKVFPKQQIPTVVNGKTYYGCCEMCASRLTSEAAVRRAVDPVSGKEVDKALAVIGADKDGRAYYFESEKTLASYVRKNNQ